MILCNGSGGSRPSDKGEPGHPDPEIRGGGGGGGGGGREGRSPKNLFSPFGPPFGLKVMGGQPPRSLPWILH